MKTKIETFKEQVKSIFSDAFNTSYPHIQNNQTEYFVGQVLLKIRKMYEEKIQTLFDNEGDWIDSTHHSLILKVVRQKLQQAEKAIDEVEYGCFKYHYLQGKIEAYRQLLEI